MHLTLNTKPNRAAVSFVAGILPKSHNLPCLTHVRLGGNEYEVSIAATDLDLTLAAILATDGKPANNEPCLLPGRKFSDFFKAGRGERITVESNCAKAAVTVDGNAFSLMQLKDDEWPKTPAYDADYSFDMAADKLLNGLLHVHDAMSTDDSRYVLNGVCFVVEHSLLTLVATDGRRLHKILIDRAPDEAWKARLVKLKVKIAGSTDGEEITKLKEKHDEEASISIIVPAGTVPHLLKLLKHTGKGNVTLDYKAGVVHPAPAPQPVEAGKPAHASPPRYMIDEPPRIRIASDTLLLSSKCILGNYPNYRQVIPTEVKEAVDVDVDAWLNALRQVEPFTSEKHNAVKLIFTARLLTMTANSPDVGQGKATVPINYTGKAQTLNYNPRYLIEGFRALKDDEHVKFGFIDELTPCLITTLKTQTVIMPMRLS